MELKEAGIPGHSFTAIIGEFSYEEEREVIRLDCDTTFKVFDGKRQFKFFNYGNICVLLFLQSPDDKRGGSITIVLIEGKDTRKEILGAIETSSFLKNNSIGYVNYMASICHKFNSLLNQIT